MQNGATETQPLPPPARERAGQRVFSTAEASHLKHGLPPSRESFAIQTVALPAKIAETLYPLEISVEGGEVSGR